MDELVQGTMATHGATLVTLEQHLLAAGPESGYNYVLLLVLHSAPFLQGTALPWGQQALISTLQFCCSNAHCKHRDHTSTPEHTKAILNL